MSGIKVDPAIADLFMDMKKRKTNKWAIFKISLDQKLVIVDQKGDPCDDTDKDEEKFKEFLENLPNEPRYCLFDFNFVNKEGRHVAKLAFIFWCEDNVPMRLKMKYADTKLVVKGIFSDLNLEFQANDRRDFDYKAWRDEVEKNA